MKEDKYGVQYSDDGKTLLHIPYDFAGEYVVPEEVEVISMAVFDYHPNSFLVPPSLEGFIVGKNVKMIHPNVGFAFVRKVVVDKANPFYDSRENCNAVIETSTNTLIIAGWKSFIPDGVKIIREYAFCHYLGRIFIPASVENIKENAFWQCQIVELIVDKKNKFYDSREGCNAIIETLTGKLVFGSRKTFIPEGVTCIGSDVFYNSWIKEVRIPNTVKKIERFAFYNAYLGRLIISSSVEEIDKMAFWNNNISKITIDSENKKYDSREGCNAIIESETDKLIASSVVFKIPSSVKIVGSESLNVGCKPVLDIPEGVEVIESNAFVLRESLEIRLPSTLIEFQKHDLGPGLKRIVVPKGQKSRFVKMKNLRQFRNSIVEAVEAD